MVEFDVPDWQPAESSWETYKAAALEAVETILEAYRNAREREAKHKTAENQD